MCGHSQPWRSGWGHSPPLACSPRPSPHSPQWLCYLSESKRLLETIKGEKKAPRATPGLVEGDGGGAASTGPARWELSALLSACGGLSRWVQGGCLGGELSGGLSGFPCRGCHCHCGAPAPWVPLAAAPSPPSKAHHEGSPQPPLANLPHLHPTPSRTVYSLLCHLASKPVDLQVPLPAKHIALLLIWLILSATRSQETRPDPPKGGPAHLSPSLDCPQHSKNHTASGLPPGCVPHLTVNSLTPWRPMPGPGAGLRKCPAS